MIYGSGHMHNRKLGSKSESMMCADEPVHCRTSSEKREQNIERWRDQF